MELLEIYSDKIKKYEELLGKLRPLIIDYDEGFCDGDEAMMFVKKYIKEIEEKTYV